MCRRTWYNRNVKPMRSGRVPLRIQRGVEGQGWQDSVDETRADVASAVNEIIDALRDIWRRNITPPKRGATASQWVGYVLLWFWSIPGAVLGASIAGYLIGKYSITFPPLQEIVSVGLAFVGTLIVSLVALAIARIGVGFNRMERQGKTRTEETLRTTLWFAAVQVAAAGILMFALVVPFLVVGGSLYWYVTHGLPLSPGAAWGAIGGLLLKGLLTIFNSAFWSPIQAVILHAGWRWLGRHPDKPKGNEE